MFLKILKTSQENPCVEAFFNKVAGLDPASFLKRQLQHKCFPVKFAKLLRTPTLKNIYKRLLLEVCKKAILKNFCNIHWAKLASDTCSMKKAFLVVNRAVKDTCFYIGKRLL